MPMENWKEVAFIEIFLRTNIKIVVCDVRCAWSRGYVFSEILVEFFAVERWEVERS